LQFAVRGIESGYFGAESIVAGIESRDASASFITLLSPKLKEVS